MRAPAAKNDRFARATFQGIRQRVATLRLRQIQGEQPGQQFIVGERRRPAVSRENSRVELPVRQIEPRRSLVIEIRQRALLEQRRIPFILLDKAWITDGADAGTSGQAISTTNDVPCPRALIRRYPRHKAARQCVGMYRGIRIPFKAFGLRL